jgi:uncharacterized membrane protein YdjX (TVP38/TMEM64 family)
MGNPEHRRNVLRTALKLALLVGLLIAAKYAGDLLLERLKPENLTPSTEPALHRLIMVTMAMYIVLMMLPFLPGAEIGLAMMMMFGPKIAPLVYGSTVLALALSFMVGRLVPQDAVIGLFQALRLRRAADLLRAIGPMDTDERIRFMLRGRSSTVVPFLMRHRYIALIALINLPGNVLIGGGGGISLVSGFSRIFSFPGFLLAVALAVAPVPLTIMMAGR